MHCGCCAGHEQDGGLAQKKEELAKVLDDYRDKPGALIPVLQEAQNIYGYLPDFVMQEIAQQLKVPTAKIYGVATFYAQFHLKPRGRNVVRVCQGTACHVRGGARVLESVSGKLGVDKNETTADLRYTLETVACLGACGLAPVMMVNEDTHGRLTPAGAAEILEKYE